MKSTRSIQSLSVLKSFLAIAAIAGTVGSAIAQDAPGTEGPGVTDLDPRGVYFNRFTGGFPGTEWFTTMPITGENRYRLADIVGGGWNAIVTPEGAVDILNAPGDGQYSDADNYILNPSFAGSTFVFNNNRAPYTDVDFPLQLVSATAGSSLLSGEYTTLTQSVNPETADILSSKTEQTTVSVIGPSFRVTDADGEFYRGSFETPTRVGFRVVVPTPSDTRFRTFPGSSLSQNQNLMGSVRITSINTFEATFLFQSRTGLGNQSQGITIMSGQRVDPYPVGDLDGDRVVDSDDRAMLVKQIGLVEADDAFNIAADLNGDYEITEADLALFDQGECSADFAEPFGELDFFDVSAFLDLFANQDPRADLAGPDGAFDFFDVSAFLDSFGAGCS
tara:strand:+ start:66258 stop:67430 length:1173 start_codon:yes stop_codon:yes gene_type:complete